MALVIQSVTLMYVIMHVKVNINDSLVSQVGFSQLVFSVITGIIVGKL